MKLPKEDAELFYEIMWTLQLFANRQKKIFPEIKTVEQIKSATLDEKLKIRQALYDNPNFFDLFVEKKPENFSEDRLEIVRNWNNRVAGEFYVERFLKRYTIFVSSKGDNVYGVTAFFDDFDEMFHPSQLPVLVRAVLLPFKGRVVNDGIMQNYNVHFGGGIRRRLKETYLTAKQNSRIIESLEPAEISGKAKTAARPRKDWKPELEKMDRLAQKLKGGNEYPPVIAPAFSLVKASVELGLKAASDAEDIDSLRDSVKKVQRALRSVSKTLERAMQ